MSRLSIRQLLCASLALATMSPAAQAQNESQPAAAPESVLVQEPQTPEEQLDAVLLMLRLDRRDLASLYLKQFLAAQPDDDVLLRLRDQYGTATFLRLSRINELQPDSQQLLTALEQAATRKLDDPTHFDALLDQLEGSPRERDAAIRAIKQFRAAAVPALLERLAQGDRVDQHSLLIYTLTSMGRVVVEPLLGALESPIERTRALAIEALGWVGTQDVVPHLWSAAFGVDQPPLVQQAARQAISRIKYDRPDRTDQVTFHGVVDEVQQLAMLHFGGQHEWMTNDDGQVLIWSWDTQQNRLVSTATTPQRASAFRAQRLAREALVMAPEREDLRALFLAASLAETGFRAGWDQQWPIGPGTAHNLAVFSGAELTEQSLHLAITHDNAAAGVGALKALGQIAAVSSLRDRDGRRSAIIAALDDSHDRVQFAAVSCILQVDPQEPFSNSRRVIEILARALQDNGGPATVVIDPNVQRAANVASLLRSIGYDATAVPTGREGFMTAASRGDITLAVVHPNAIRWELTQTVANFRADARTREIPLAIYGPLGVRDNLAYLLDRTSHSKFVVVGGDSGDWQKQLVSLVNAVDVPPLTVEQRAQRTATAAYWLRHIAEGCRTELYDLSHAEAALVAALENPAIATDAAVALAAIPTASVQERLAEVVTAPAASPEQHEAAAWQLSQHIRRFGRLLGESRVTELKQTWQTSDDPRIRTSLTNVLGALGTTPQAVGAALQNHELSPTP